MVIFHSYVSLPEGNQNWPLKISGFFMGESPQHQCPASPSPTLRRWRTWRSKNSRMAPPEASPLSPLPRRSGSELSMDQKGIIERDVYMYNIYIVCNIIVICMTCLHSDIILKYIIIYIYIYIYTVTIYIYTLIMYVYIYIYTYNVCLCFHWWYLRSVYIDPFFLGERWPGRLSMRNAGSQRFWTIRVSSFFKDLLVTHPMLTSCFYG